MEAKIGSAGSEEEKQQLKSQITQAQTGNVMSNFNMYSQQKAPMYSQMQVLAAPRMMQMQMPMMMPQMNMQMQQFGGMQG